MPPKTPRFATATADDNNNGPADAGRRAGGGPPPAAPDVAARQLDRLPDGTLAWAAGGRLDREALDILASAGVSTVVVRDKAAPAVPGLGYTPSGYLDVEASGGSVRALVADKAP